jgi:hypothetical protein
MGICHSELTLRDLISAAALVLALAIAIGNAIWQSWLQRRQLKHTLFEKRFPIYVATRAFLNGITSSVDAPSPRTFLQETRAVEWLFPSVIGSFVNEVYTKANDLQTLNEEIKQAHENDPSANVRQLKEQRLALEKWFATDAQRIAREKFTPFLRLG